MQTCDCWLSISTRTRCPLRMPYHSLSTVVSIPAQKVA